LQELDIVEFGELAPIAGNDELLEFAQRLAAQVGAVNEEEDAPRTAEPDEAIDALDGHVGFAAAHRHLDKGARAILGERAFEVGDGLDLAIAQVVGRQWRQAEQAGAQGIILLVGNAFGSLLKPFGQRFGLVKGEDGTAARFGIEVAGEASFDAGGFVGKGKGIARDGDIIGDAGTIFGALLFHAGQCLSDGFGFDDANGLTINEEEIVSRAFEQRIFAHSNATPGAQVDGIAILHDPTGLREVIVDLLARAFLWFHEWLFLCSAILSHYTSSMRFNG
jgi:hypothetical protein